MHYGRHSMPAADTPSTSTAPPPEPPSSPAAPPHGEPAAWGGVHTPDPPRYFAWSLLSTFLCCQLTGVIALIYGGLVSSRLDAGDFDGAVDASRKAFMWLLAGPFVWVVGGGLWGAVGLATWLVSPHG